MLDSIAHGSPRHGPVHLLLISAAEIGCARDGEKQGWIRAALPPLRMLTGPIQHFQNAFLKLGSTKLVLSWLISRDSGSVSGCPWICTTTYLFPLAEIKCC